MVGVWWGREAVRYAALCAGGWTILALVSAYTGGGGIGSRLGLALVTLVWMGFLYGVLFGVPTLLIILGLSALRARERALRLTALALLPLPVLLLPVELPPSSQYGAQVLFQMPVQVATALLLRPVRPPGEGVPRGPAGWWYALPAIAVGWLALLLATGAPLYADWLPLGPGRAAQPVSSGDTVRFGAEPGHRYIVYQHRIEQADRGETCSVGGVETRQGHPAWIWDRPPARVTHEGRDYAYRETVSRGDGSAGPIELSCDTGPLLVEDAARNGRSPVGPAVVAVFVAIAAAYPALAFSHRRSRAKAKARGSS